MSVLLPGRGRSQIKSIIIARAAAAAAGGIVLLSGHGQALHSGEPHQMEMELGSPRC